MKLPSESLASQADNPAIFESFENSNGLVGNSMFDHAILCRDRSEGTYTWHVLCGKYVLSDICTPWARPSVEQDVSRLRHGRDLEFTEVVSRTGEHYFL
jgi:hypothetical protein